MRVKILLMENSYLVVIFQLGLLWYGLSREVRIHKRLKSIWSIKRILLLSEGKMSVSIQDENLDKVSMKKENIIELDLNTLDLWKMLADKNAASIELKQKLMMINESARKGLV